MRAWAQPRHWLEVVHEARRPRRAAPRPRIVPNAGQPHLVCIALRYTRSPNRRSGRPGRGARWRSAWQLQGGAARHADLPCKRSGEGQKRQVSENGRERLGKANGILRPARRCARLRCARNRGDRICEGPASRHSNIRAGIKFIDELPKTASGKIQRFKLRAAQRPPSFAATGSALFLEARTSRRRRSAWGG
jgi:hypothetical protein